MNVDGEEKKDEDYDWGVPNIWKKGNGLARR